MARGPVDILVDWQIFFFLGIAGLFFGGFFLLIGLIVSYMGSSSGAGGLFLWIFAPLCLIPGVILAAVGLRKRRHAKDIENLASLLRTYRRIKIQRVAQKLGITEFEAEKRIAICVDRGLVKGYIDRSTEEFFTVESLGHVIPQTGCPKCGAPPERIILVGEIAKCGSCGAAIPRNGV